MGRIVAVSWPYRSVFNACLFRSIQKRIGFNCDVDTVHGQHVEQQKYMEREGPNSTLLPCTHLSHGDLVLSESI
jgi:hypothetical protein